MNAIRILFTTSSALCVGLAFSGCADEAPAPQGGLRIIQAAVGTCSGTANGNRDLVFPVGSDRVVVEVTAPHIPEPIRSSFTAADVNKGAVVVQHIPPGEDISLHVVGCAGAAANWAGEAHGISVTKSEKSFPDVFLTPVGQLACPGSSDSAQASLPSPRAFASMATIDDQVWVLGGFGTYEFSKTLATATTAVAVYDRLGSDFADGGVQLDEARGWALGDAIGGSEVRLIGGATHLRIREKGGPPPVWVRPADAPACGVARFDTATGTSACESGGPAPALPSVVKVSGSPRLYVAVGGVVPVPAGQTPPFGAPTPNAALGQASQDVWIIRDAGVSKTVIDPRFGATVVPLTGEQVLVWGGNVDGDAINTGYVLDTTAGTVTRLTGTIGGPVPLFASGAYLGVDGAGLHQVLIVGGGDITQTGFPLAVQSARLLLVKVDVAGAHFELTPLDPGDNAATFTRAAASLVDLGNGDLWWFGGYTNFAENKTVCPNSTGACLQTTMTRFSVDAAAGTVTVKTPTLDLGFGSAADGFYGALGASVAPLGDESWLITGGLYAVGRDEALDPAAALVRYWTPSSALCQ
jgi:hypothetical protein